MPECAFVANGRPWSKHGPEYPLIKQFGFDICFSNCRIGYADLNNVELSHIFGPGIQDKTQLGKGHGGSKISPYCRAEGAPGISRQS